MPALPPSSHRTVLHQLSRFVSAGRPLVADRALAAPALVAGIAWLVLCSIWGSTWLAIKVGLESLPPISFAAIRFAIAAAILLAIARLGRMPFPRGRGEWVLLANTGALTITVNYGLIFWGEQYISSGLAALLNATVPLFGLPIAHRYLAAEPLTRRKLGGVLLGIAGLAAVFASRLEAGGSLALWASAGMLVASAATAWAGVLVKARITHLEPAVLAGVQMAFGGVPLAAGGLLLEGDPRGFTWTAEAIASLGYLALVGSVVAFLLYYWLMRRVDVTRVLLIPLVTPLIAVGLGFAVLGETVGWTTALGGAAILAGVALVVLRRRGGGHER